MNSIGKTGLSGHDRFGFYRWWNEEIRVYGSKFDEASFFTCFHARFGGTCVGCVKTLQSEMTAEEYERRLINGEAKKKK